ncbi:MAG: hypothetical protein QM710_10490 [Flavobacterium sp.]
MTREKNIFKTLFLLTAAAFIGYIIYTVSKETPNDDESICLKYGKEPMGTLETKLIQNMVSNYRNNQLRAINSNVDSINDAHSISFDLVTLKKFIYHIENESRKIRKTITDEQLGVRMYYAAYPDNSAWNDYNDLSNVDRNYEHLHTLILIPTIESNGKKIDFNPLDEATFENGITRQDVQLKSANFRTSQANRDIIGITGATNHGSLIPPATSNVEGF